ncbi:MULTISPECIES: SMI1/KNR4 family protein [Streptosporangium]|uniref:Knr4/Smi1-like domain-containing protein n=1 Tax=Streptosporangium brasiliense TaxID=47480 RepID=A0ABT9QZP3_9ACTN|nr:SMI1/KNR4 family protein [Streptosporangium brasiliense]MDP9861680.1 hypothetical protein [Streptosporangium brasiliense]
MLRLITSRWVRLALVAAVAAAIVVAVLRLRRRPAASGAALRAEPAAVPRPEPGPAPAAQWPPAPILGTPTARDLDRYATRAYIPRFLAAAPPAREPLDHATRRRLVRWGAAAAALCLLVFASQALENATFSKGTTATEATGEVRFEDPSDPVAGSCYPGWAPPTTAPGTRAVELCPEDGDGGVSEDWSQVDASSPDATPAPDVGSPAEPYRVVPDADCRPAVRQARVRPLSPRVTRAVNRQWARIERWLKANAPVTHRTLAPPARARTIAVAEAQMGLRFPNDLRASLLRHNGAGAAGGFGLLANGLLGVREIRDTWRELCELDGQDRGPDPRVEWWDGRMIPIGADGNGGYLVIDSMRRDVGETDSEDQLDFAPGGIAVRSHYALLKAAAEALETGGSVGYWRPRAVDGALDWEVVD